MKRSDYSTHDKKAHDYYMTFSSVQYVWEMTCVCCNCSHCSECSYNNTLNTTQSTTALTNLLYTSPYLDLLTDSIR